MQEQVSHPGTSLAIHVGARDDPLVSHSLFSISFVGATTPLHCSQECGCLWIKCTRSAHLRRCRQAESTTTSRESQGISPGGEPRSPCVRYVPECLCRSNRADSLRHRQEGRGKVGDRQTHTCTLPRVQFAGSGVKGSWPICYDYLADQSECPKIDETGVVSAIH